MTSLRRSLRNWMTSLKDQYIRDNRNFSPNEGHGWKTIWLWSQRNQMAMLCKIQNNGTGPCKQNETPLLVPNNPYLQYQKQFYCTEAPPPPPSTKSPPPRESTGKPTGDVCEDRESYFFWDELHLTRAANRIIVDKCFRATTSGGICSSYDIHQLANQKWWMYRALLSRVFSW